MVLGEGYDNSLWLILASNDENRERIAECIANMPREVLTKIQEIIIESQGNDKVYVETSNVCYFSLRIKNGILYVQYDKHDKKGQVGDEFALSLIPIDKKMLMNRKFYSKKYIGWFMETKKDLIKSSIGDDLFFEDSHEMVMEYKLINTPLGIIIETNYEKDKCVGPKGHYGVRVKSMPDKMFIHQFEDKQKLNRIVRKRIKK